MALASAAAAVVFMLTLDALWLAATKNMYAAGAARVQGKSVLNYRFNAWPGAVFAYVAMIVGVCKFVLNHPTSNRFAFVLNAIAFGFALYGVYNGTSMVLYSEYPTKIAIIDTLWGMTLLAATAVFYTSVLTRTSPCKSACSTCGTR